MVLESSPVERDDGTHQRLANMVSYIGVGGPRIMLTQEPEYDYPYYAMLLVNTADPGDTPGLAAEVRKRVRNIYNARVTVDEFLLGPPIKDPVAFRLSGPDPDILRNKARDMVKLFKDTPGVVGPYSNWGATAYAVENDLQQARERLKLLAPEEPAAPVVELAERLIEAGGSAEDIAGLARLAEALGALTPALTPYLESGP